MDQERFNRQIREDFNKQLAQQKQAAKEMEEKHKREMEALQEKHKSELEE